MKSKIKKCSLVFIIAALVGTVEAPVRAETLTDDQIKAAIQQDKERLYKQYNITVANPGEYPVTIFDNDKVPLPYGDSMAPFKWVDNDTLIYMKKEEPPSYSDTIINVNLKTFEIKKVADGSGLCYDSETHRIVYSARSPKEGHSLIKYGIYEQTLKTQEYSNDEFKSGHYPYYVNSFDCTFYTPKPDFRERGTPLRDGDGYVRSELAPVPLHGTNYLHINKAGEAEKRIPSIDTVPTLHYDYFSHLYWFTHITPDHVLAVVVRLDKHFNTAAEEIYPAGVEYGYSVKGGFISASVRGARDMNGKLIRGKAGEVYFSMGGMSLTTEKSGSVEILEGDIRNISVSPNGCRAVFLYTQDINKPSPGQVGVIDLCKNLHEKEK